MMYGDEKSDPFIVAGKPANGDGRPEPERVERREGAEENRDKPARAGPRAGQACPLDWTVYGQLQGWIGRNGSPRCSTMSMPGCFAALHPSPPRGTDGSNPASSSSQSVSAVNPAAIGEKPRTLAAVCGWLGT